MTFGATVELDLSPVGSLPAAKLDTGSAGDLMPREILTDRQNSVSLCLYTLLGLGLCRTAPWLKRLCLGLSPDWYHSGGPYQIGHSFAIAPDCLFPALIYCFIQPDCMPAAEDSPPGSRWGIVVSLWRQSQFTPTVLAGRGPPDMS